MYRHVIKRFLDLLFSSIFLVVLSPVILIIGLLVRIKLGSPILFKQPRPGLDEHVFQLIKFRTMTSKKDKYGELLPDRERMTSFGSFLRSTSLDELPELWCILKGEMSFVGPRPLSVLYLPHYTDEEAIRHDVRPGLTGLAQVSGRNALDWDTRLNYDVDYVKNLSFALDCVILLRTFKQVISRKGIVSGKFGDLDEVRPVLRQPKHLEVHRKDRC